MQEVNKLTPFFENLNFEREDNTMVINFGPQHPSAHGQLRLVLELDGEQVRKGVSRYRLSTSWYREDGREYDL